MGKLWDNTESRDGMLSNPLTWMQEYLGVSNSAEVPVNTESSMRLTAVKACVEILSTSVASLPWDVFERTGPNTKEKAITHSLYPVLHSETNDVMSAFNYRETAMMQLLYWGNHYALKLWDGAGNIYALKMLNAWNMKVQVNDKNQVEYEYTDSDGKKRIYPKWQIFHVPGMGFNGLVGIPPLALISEAVANGLALQIFGNKFFANGTNTGVYVTHPTKMSDTAYERLAVGFNEKYRGVQNSNKGGIVLEEGADIKRLDLAPEQAQFIESRKFSVNEIARAFRVPPHMIGDLDRATFSNIEQQGIDFVTNTLRPWLSRWEAAANMQLFTRQEKPKFYSAFNVNDLLRGDIVTRYKAYATGKQNGWLSANDVRNRENMNPIENGDEYYVQLNMQTVEQSVKDEEEGTNNAKT